MGRKSQSDTDAAAEAGGTPSYRHPDDHPALLERVRALDAMCEAGDLTIGDRGLAVARARNALIRGKELPDMPKRSRQSQLDYDAERARKKELRTERKETGLSRKEQQERDALAAATANRDAMLDRRRAAFDLALAQGRMTEAQHAEALSRLDMLLTQPVVVQRPVKQKSTFWTVFDGIDPY